MASGRGVEVDGCRNQDGKVSRLMELDEIKMKMELVGIRMSRSMELVGIRMPRST
jgi:hypothetical protein